MNLNVNRDSVFKEIIVTIVINEISYASIMSTHISSF